MLNRDYIQRFNLPEGFFNKVDGRMNAKSGDLLIGRIEIINKLSDAINAGSKELQEKLWAENEVELLKQGTSKDQLLSFAKEVMCTIMSAVIDRVIESAKE